MYNEIAWHFRTLDGNQCANKQQEKQQYRYEKQ